MDKIYFSCSKCYEEKQSKASSIESIGRLELQFYIGQSDDDIWPEGSEGMRHQISGKESIPGCGRKKIQRL